MPKFANLETAVAFCEKTGCPKSWIRTSGKGYTVSQPKKAAAAAKKASNKRAVKKTSKTGSTSAKKAPRKAATKKAPRRKKAPLVGPHGGTRRCDHCGAFHDVSAHWSHAQGPAMESSYKTERRGDQVGPTGLKEGSYVRLRPAWYDEHATTPGGPPIRKGAIGVVTGWRDNIVHVVFPQGDVLRGAHRRRIWVDNLQGARKPRSGGAKKASKASKTARKTVRASKTLDVLNVLSGEREKLRIKLMRFGEEWSGSATLDDGKTLPVPVPYTGSDSQLALESAVRWIFRTRGDWFQPAARQRARPASAGGGVLGDVLGLPPPPPKKRSGRKKDKKASAAIPANITRADFIRLQLDRGKAKSRKQAIAQWNFRKTHKK